MELQRKIGKTCGLPFLTNLAGAQVHFTGLALTVLEQSAPYKDIVEKWSKAYVKAFGEVDVTHCVVSLS